ncbi:MAG: antitoxin of toxin-antitoxin stability system [Pseudotabrizicola sp.]|uniref:antitoxin of toxin-antitoxin stability system n=1 Tax=Pseudotabrizicola sp. TaxID=2939647 RepID=UPI00271E4E4A|nr:antitoxin of toxin-antitoxin stability system [Pseudotabrizicola sp.]MDO9640777.1 antitoxin of toxin-antitoxin stability system [Pseudotabrizicola sp.]
MPQLIATTVYRIDELPEGAKDSARAWYREGGFDHDWYDAVYEDFQRIAEILGIRLKTRTTRLIGGRTLQDPSVWFSGFWSQGDGAAWEGFYSYRKYAAAELRAYAPKDKTLHRIAETLQAAQRQNFYQLRAEVSHRGNYYHAFTMAVSVSRHSVAAVEIVGDAESIVTDALRDLANWLYRQLEQEYEYLTSDEAVDETLIANGYTFTEEGRRFR